VTIAIITLAIAVSILSAAMISSFVWGRRELMARVAAEEDKLVEVRKATDLEVSRDEARGLQVKAEKERDEAKASALIHQADALAAREELKAHVREKLVTGTDDDVAAEVDRLLGGRKVQAVPVVPTSTTGDGGGST
jgi:hypothetical protein